MRYVYIQGCLRWSQLLSLFCVLMFQEGKELLDFTAVDKVVIKACICPHSYFSYLEFILYKFGNTAFDTAKDPIRSSMEEHIQLMVKKLPLNQTF